MQLKATGSSYSNIFRKAIKPISVSCPKSTEFSSFRNNRNFNVDLNLIIHLSVQISSITEPNHAVFAPKSQTMLLKRNEIFFLEIDQIAKLNLPESDLASKYVLKYHGTPDS